MKKTYNTKKKRTTKYKWLTLLVVFTLAVAWIKITQIGVFTPVMAQTNIEVPKPLKKIDLSPTVDVVKDEIIAQARLFGVDENYDLSINEC